MLKITLFACTLFLISACTNETGSSDVEHSEQQTPEVLNDKGKRFSYSKRYSSDMIQELFDEALENDQDLKALTERLDQVGEMKLDSLEAYRVYMSNNQNYWLALAKYSSRLSDSTMKKDLLQMVDRLKEQQSQRTAILDSLAKDIDNREEALDDLEILMKIIVTEPMMRNYQHKEIPHTQALESVKQALDSSIYLVKPYTKIEE